VIGRGELAAEHLGSPHSLGLGRDDTPRRDENLPAKHFKRIKKSNFILKDFSVS
jgi:hypothetical protein